MKNKITGKTLIAIALILTMGILGSSATRLVMQSRSMRLEAEQEEVRAKNFDACISIAVQAVLDTQRMYCEANGFPADESCRISVEQAEKIGSNADNAVSECYRRFQ
jgi:hypothetical protein